MPLCEAMEPITKSTPNDITKQQHSFVAKLLLASGINSNGSIQNPIMYTQDDVLLINGTSNNDTLTEHGRESWLTLSDLQMIKVIVLVVVVGLLLASTCRVVFQTFSRYSVKRPDLDDYHG